MYYPCCTHTVTPDEVRQRILPILRLNSSSCLPPPRSIYNFHIHKHLAILFVFYISYTTIIFGSTPEWQPHPKQGTIPPIFSTTPFWREAYTQPSITILSVLLYAGRGMLLGFIYIDGACFVVVRKSDIVSNCSVLITSVQRTSDTTIAYVLWFNSR